MGDRPLTHTKEKKGWPKDHDEEHSSQRREAQESRDGLQWTTRELVHTILKFLACSQDPRDDEETGDMTRSTLSGEIPQVYHGKSDQCGKEK
jgi:hypothetical protein